MAQQQTTDGMGRVQRAIKRVADIVCAAVGLVLLSPVAATKVRYSAAEL